jgi:TRAP-type mannitol/chloroaromatic compound transport system substrate-binding protein
MDANMLLAWHNYGGGKEILADIYKSLNLDVVSFPYGPMPVEPLGWYKKPIRSVDDFKGLKFRTVGLGIEMYTAMGAAVNALPGSEIVPALDRGLIDAAEFNNPSSDRALGFPDVSKVYMMQSFHQSAETFEILFNKTKYDALSDNLKSIIANAVEAASANMSWKAIDRRRSRRKPPTIRGSRRCWIPRRGSRNALPSGSTTRTWIFASRSITTSARRPRRPTAVPCTTPRSRGGVLGRQLCQIA